MISIKVDTEEVERFLNSVPAEINKALAAGINRLAQKVQEEGKKLVMEKFPTATRYTQNGIFIRPAAPRALTARVGFNVMYGGAGHYLDAQVTGGGRRDKGFEKKFDNRFAMPAKGAPLDGAGNLSRAALTKMLAAYTAGKAGKGQTGGVGQYFSIDKQRGRMKPGVYMRTASGDQKTRFLLAKQIIKQGKHKGLLKELKTQTKAQAPRGARPVLLLGVKAPKYRATFDFTGMAEKVVARYGEEYLCNYLHEALRL